MEARLAASLPLVSLLWIVVLPFLGALPPLLVRPGARTRTAWVAAAPVAIALALVLGHTPEMMAGGVVRQRWEWMPAAGLELYLRLDALAWLFAIIVLGIGLLVQLYARYYMSEYKPLGRFYALLALFIGAMTGLLLSGNLILLVIFWELTSLSSFLLIGYKHADPEARLGARAALTVTATGGLALLAAALLLGHIAGGFALEDVLVAGDVIRGHSLYIPTLVLFLLGAFTKSAQVPFHFWLPRAMAAPTPISAYLHSATMVKAGVFLLARFYPALSGSDAWFTLVGTVGMATLLYGAYQAMWQHDLKGLLAYSTISHLGLITLLFGFGTPTAAVAAVFHIVNHATFKASLFMAAGIIDHEVGTRDMRVLNGLWQHMPYTGALAIVAAGAMAGVPLLNGFLSKEMFFAEALAVPRVPGLRWMEPALATLAAALSVGYSLRFIMEVFFNASGVPLPRIPKGPPRFMRLPVEMLALLCVLVGTAPAFLVEPILTRAAAAVLGGNTPQFSLSLWHGFNLPLLMTVVALGGGIAIYRARERLFAWHDRIAPPFDAYSTFDRSMTLAARWSGRATRALENGSLQRYAALAIATAIVFGIAPLLGSGESEGVILAAASLPEFSTILAWVMLVAAAIATVVWHRDRLAAVIAISTVGLFVALAFVKLSAPDLALTQLLVEVVTILLLLLALHHLPKIDAPASSALRRGRDLILALGAGLGSGALAWAILRRPANSISDYYLAESVPKGGGTNVVNVLLVDFRAFDTIGEVAVLGAAAVGVVALLDGVRAPAVRRDARPRFAERHSVILKTISRPFLPLALLISAYLLLRGHDLPGGGFAAGLLTAVALIVQFMASGAEWTAARRRLDFRRVVAGGVLLAAATGAGSWLFGRPFLTSFYDYATVGGILKVPLSSALLFDLGVFATVVGAVMLILERIGRLTPEQGE